MSHDGDDSFDSVVLVLAIGTRLNLEIASAGTTCGPGQPGTRCMPRAEAQLGKGDRLRPSSRMSSFVGSNLQDPGAILAGTSSR